MTEVTGRIDEGAQSLKYAIGRRRRHWCEGRHHRQQYGPRDDLRLRSGIVDGRPHGARTTRRILPVRYDGGQSHHERLGSLRRCDQLGNDPAEGADAGDLTRNRDLHDRADGDHHLLRLPHGDDASVHDERHCSDIDIAHLLCAVLREHSDTGAGARFQDGLD